MAHVIVFIIVISIIGLIHLLAVSLSVNLFLTLMNDGGTGELGLMASAMGIYFFLPKTYIFMIIAFSVAMYRRGVYGKAHEKATLAALLTAILGTIAPFFIFALAMAFEKGYLAAPLLGHSIFVAVFVAFYLFVKDLGAKSPAIAGLAIYILGSIALVGIETIAIYDENHLSEGGMKVLSAMAIPWTIVLCVGIIMFLVAYANALKWVKTHKPKIDDQQAEQIYMQKEIIVMQKQQIDMLERTVSMLTEIKTEMIDQRTEMIPETAGYAEMKLDEEPP